MATPDAGLLGQSSSPTPASASDSPAAADQDTLPRFEPADCPGHLRHRHPGQVECGYLIVPEDRNALDSPSLRLAVAIVKSLSPSPQADPVVYLTGGPGYGALYLEEPGGLLRQDRDIILIDPRGSSYSEPDMQCPELVNYFQETRGLPMGPAERTDLQIQAAAACRDRLEGEGVNLAAYNSAAVAADIADLRRVLGYEEWNVFAESYGTRVALTLMREHPDGIRSVVLTGVFPPQVQLLTENAPKIDAAFTRFFDACENHPACHATYPHLKDRFFNLVERLNAAPIVVQARDVRTGERVDQVITGDDLVAGLFLSMYDSQAMRLMPLVTHQMSNGRYDLVEELAAGVTPYVSDPMASQGVYFSTHCHEDIAFEDPAQIKAAVSDYPHLRGFLDTYLLSERFLEICDLWGAGEGRPSATEPVYSDIPTLLITGEYDPVTPSSWARLAGETLTNGVVLEIPGAGHMVGVLPCPQKLISDFVDDPTSRPAHDCLNAMGSTPDFVNALYVEGSIYGAGRALVLRPEPWHLLVAGLSVLVFMSVLGIWPVRLMLKWRRGRATSACYALWVAAIMALVGLFAMGGLLLLLDHGALLRGELLAFGLPPAAPLLKVFPYVAVALTVAVLTCAVWAWTHRQWSCLARLHYSAVALAGTGFTWSLIQWI